MVFHYKGNQSGSENLLEVRRVQVASDCCHIVDHFICNYSVYKPTLRFRVGGNFLSLGENSLVVCGQKERSPDMRCRGEDYLSTTEKRA
jgi:hypothetical protein